MVGRCLISERPMASRGRSLWPRAAGLLAWTFIVGAGLLVIAMPVGAQAGSATSGGAGAVTTPKAPAPAAQSPTPAGGIAAMKSDLLQLVSANEVYLAKHKWYSEDLKGLTGFRPSPGVSIMILSADADGWSASATNTLLPGKSCVIFVGPVKVIPTTQADGRSGSEAVPVCDAAAPAAR
jgi:hypothetical protein